LDRLNVHSITKYLLIHSNSPAIDISQSKKGGCCQQAEYSRPGITNDSESCFTLLCICTAICACSNSPNMRSISKLSVRPFQFQDPLSLYRFPTNKEDIDPLVQDSACSFFRFCQCSFHLVAFVAEAGPILSSYAFHALTLYSSAFALLS
jgi:hypothetical protein